MTSRGRNCWILRFPPASHLRPRPSPRPERLRERQMAHRSFRKTTLRQPARLRTGSARRHPWPIWTRIAGNGRRPLKDPEARANPSAWSRTVILKRTPRRTVGPQRPRKGERRRGRRATVRPPGAGAREAQPIVRGSRSITRGRAQKPARTPARKTRRRRAAWKPPRRFRRTFIHECITKAIVPSTARVHGFPRSTRSPT
mmetsp:Transcript_101882/g.287464  ORF Transcript_101882/g.287464 Transcript_101882/m.287464 type:complete len:200 (+) Transcript_101882:3083-3682(+)